MKKTLIIGGAVALLAGGFAIAQTADQHAPRGDADGDGRVSRAEFIDRSVDRLSRSDADGDGMVTSAERDAAKQARRAEMRDKMFTNMDADGDGSVTRAEFDASPQMERGHGRRGWRGHGRGEHGDRAERDVVIAEAQAKAEARFAETDADGDGYLSAEERSARRDARREAWQERREARRAARAAAAE